MTVMNYRTKAIEQNNQTMYSFTATTEAVDVVLDNGQTVEQLFLHVTCLHCMTLFKLKDSHEMIKWRNKITLKATPTFSAALQKHRKMYTGKSSFDIFPRALQNALIMDLLTEYKHDLGSFQDCYARTCKNFQRCARMCEIFDGQTKKLVYKLYFSKAASYDVNKLQVKLINAIQTHNDYYGAKGDTSRLINIQNVILRTEIGDDISWIMSEQ
jgi:hypothetical protein